MNHLLSRVKYFADICPEQIFTTYFYLRKDSVDLTYAALLVNANRVAKKMTALGVKKGDLVELILETGPAMPEIFLGCVLIGAIPAFLSPPSLKVDPERYVHMIASLIKRSEPKYVFSFPSMKKRFLSVWKNMELKAELITIDDLEEVPEIQFETFQEINPDEAMFLQHSSGTTGLQKGVMIGQRALENQLRILHDRIELSQKDKIVSWLPIYHDMGLIACFLFPMYWGTHVIEIPTFDWLQRPDLFFEAITTYQGTLAWLPNFSYKFMADKARIHSNRWNLSSLRLLINCSEPISDAVHEAFLKRFSEFGFCEKTFSSSYAMAENVFAVTQNEPGRRPTKISVSTSDFQKGKVVLAQSNTLTLVSSGTPVDGTQITIVGSNGDQLSDDRIGEIVITGDCMFSGYFHNKNATDKALRNDRYFSGDLGFIHCHELYVTGRKNDMIVCAGKNIYPQDIEKLANESKDVHSGRLVAFGIYDKDVGTDKIILLAEKEPKSNVRSIAKSEKNP